MTDEQLDARLRLAGERWRATAVDQAGVIATPPPQRRPSWLLLASAAAIVAALVVGAVALWPGSDRSTSPAAASLGEHTWQVRSFSAGPSSKLVEIDSAATLHFHDGLVVGSDGCNEIVGQARITDETIAFGDYAMTQIGCTGADVVDRFVAGTVSYSVTPTALTIAKGGVGTLFLSPADASASSPIGRWRLSSTETTHTSGNSASGSVAGATGATIFSLARDGRFTVTFPCGGLVGRARIDGRTLDLDKIVWSQPPCPSHVNASAQQNALVAALLVGKVGWQVEDGQLTITKGTRGLIFERA